MRAGADVFRNTITASMRTLHCPRIMVPGTPGRALTLFGTRLEPSFDGSATIDCPASVTATSGPILLVYPLAENDPWVIIPGVVLLAVGWVYSRRQRA